MREIEVRTAQYQDTIVAVTASEVTTRDATGNEGGVSWAWLDNEIGIGRTGPLIEHLVLLRQKARRALAAQDGPLPRIVARSYQLSDGVWHYAEAYYFDPEGDRRDLLYLTERGGYTTAAQAAQVAEDAVSRWTAKHPVAGDCWRAYAPDGLWGGT
jgi:hypothetical protein